MSLGKPAIAGVDGRRAVHERCLQYKRKLITVGELLVKLSRSKKASGCAVRDRLKKVHPDAHGRGVNHRFYKMRALHNLHHTYVPSIIEAGAAQCWRALDVRQLAGQQRRRMRRPVGFQAGPTDMNTHLGKLICIEFHALERE